MPALVNYGGQFCHKRPLYTDIFTSLAPKVDVYWPSLKKARFVVPPVFSLEADFDKLEGTTIDTLPDECLFEILRRLPDRKERSNSACVSKRWLMLLSSLRASDMKHQEKEASSRSPKKPQLDLNGYPVATDEEEEEDESGDHLTRSLSEKDATDNRLAAIAVGINGRGGLGELLIRGSHPTHRVTDVGLSAIARGCPTLKILSLWNVPSVTDAGLVEIAEGCPMLEKIDLIMCPKITDTGLISIAQKCPKLTTVSLEACSGIENEGLQAIGRSCSMLKSISIKGCAKVGDQGVASLVCSASASIEKIMLQNVDITDASLAVIGHYGKLVTKLVFSDLKNVNERGFWVMGSAQGLQKLKTLIIYSCNGVTDFGLEAVVKGSPNLKQLNLRNCAFVSDTGLAVIGQFARAIESLHLECCNQVTLYGILATLFCCNARLKSLSLIKCSGIKDIVDYPAQLPWCPSLHSLTICDCPGFTSSSLVVVQKICPDLEQIDLSGLAGVTDTGLLPLVQSSESRLVEVNLRGCISLTDAVICAIVMAHGETLKSLNISECRMVTDKSLLMIGEYCSVLEELELSKCGVTDYGVAVLASARQINLRALSLSGCSNVTDRSLPFLSNMRRSLVGLNLLQCNKISGNLLNILDEKLWWCNILS